MSKISRYNHEGYRDPTASTALERALSDDRTRSLIRRIKQLIAEEDFELLSRIQLRDNKTGRVHR